MLNLNTEIKNLIIEFPKYWNKKLLRKENLFHKPKEYEKVNYYLETGIIKIFVTNDDKLEETIVALAGNDTALLPYRENHMQIINVFGMRTITEVVLHTINADNWNSIKKEKPKLIDEITQLDSIQISNKMAKLSLLKSYTDAETRYKKALEINPFLSKLKYSDIASYLGISIRTVADIKSKLNNENIK